MFFQEVRKEDHTQKDVLEVDSFFQEACVGIS